MSALNATLPSTPTDVTRNRWGVVAACTAIMLAEGFDLLIYSNAIPSLLTDALIGLDKSGAGVVGSMAFAGMLVGGLMAGRLVAWLGLARVMLTGFLVFTAATAAVAYIGSAWQLGALRLGAGLALGLVLPAALSLARGHVQAQHGALAISIVMSGLPLGGMLAALVSREIIPSGGWRPLFLAGGVLGLVLVVVVAPLVIRAARDLAATASSIDGGPWRAVFTRASKPVLMIGTLATLADLLTWYGVATWLTQLMREFEIPFQGAMQLMFTLSIGAIVGSLCTAALAIRLGTRPVAMAAGLVACACLLAIASRSLPGWGLFAVVALLGMSAISAQNLVNALVADAFPAQHRATAIGITLGLGRLGAVAAPVLGGQILAAGHGPSWVLVAFAASALLGTALLLGLGRARIQASVDSLR
ncbi:MFS transporter [Ottowia sp.]|uniref:MFS transporter n=1 Tax=Ottowia sp. TaxID=1898956 RepID=UPI003A839A91